MWRQWVRLTFTWLRTWPGIVCLVCVVLIAGLIFGARAVLDEEAPTTCGEGARCTVGTHFVHRGDTANGTRRFDTYGCAPGKDESGPELIYPLDVAEDGFLALELSALDDGADVDIHLLSAEDPQRCLARGHWRLGRWLTAGRYWVVADTWVDGSGKAHSGAFTLTGHLTTAADLEGAGMGPQVASEALYALGVGWADTETKRFDYAITDFSRPSSEARLWIFDLLTGEQLWRLHVTHGSASSDPDDATRAVTFSNIPESHQSSLGMIRTAESYVGEYGVSHRLDGLEEGFNDNVRRRFIVLHPWAGSRPAYVKAHGMTAPSWGCAAIDDEVAPEVVARLANGALMLFWHPESEWHRRSKYMP
ncbi:MAG: murein L,D-transpeptidase catalytic domain family protein [Bradymonadia bacterium]